MQESGLGAGSNTGSENGQRAAGLDVPPEGHQEHGGTAISRDAWLRTTLHDLCQPLMALECLLYVNREAVADEPLEASLLRRVMDEGLVECGRMLVLVRAMQRRLVEDEEA